jgi:hypothetical protein
MTHPNCLDLDPQDGDLELVEQLELHFGFVPTQEKVGGWLTLGDVHSTLQAELVTQTEGACPSLRTYNLLRSALIASGTARDALRTETPLAALAGGRPSRFLVRLGKQTALEMPSSRFAAVGIVGSIMFTVGFVGSIVLAVNRQWQPALWLLIPMIVGLILIRRDKGRWPPGVQTLGDLAVRVAGLNHERLGEVRDLPDTLWQRLTAIVAEQSDMPPQHMRSDTLLFAPRKSLRERLAGS